MYQINNMRRVRFMRLVRHIYYSYFKYAETHIWGKTRLLLGVLYRRCFMAGYVRLTVWSVFLFAWFMDTIKSYLLGRCK